MGSGWHPGELQAQGHPRPCAQPVQPQEGQALIASSCVSWTQDWACSGGLLFKLSEDQNRHPCPSHSL